MARVGCSTSGRSVGHAQLAAHLRPSPRAGPFVEPVVDGGGRDPPPLRERPAGLLVDRHVPPTRVVGRPRRELGVLLALPRQVVVAQHGGPPGQVLRHGLPDGGVHRERADVVDDHEVGVAERVVELGARRRPDRVDRRGPRPARRPARRRPRSSRACPVGAGRSPTVRPSPRRRRPFRAGRTGSPRVDRPACTMSGSSRQPAAPVEGLWSPPR